MSDPSENHQPAAARPRGSLPTAVVLLGVTSLFADVGSEMIFPLLPVFLGQLHAGPAFLGLVEGIADAIAAFVKLASGEAADRLRLRKPLVVAGYVLAGLVRPLVAVATAPWHVLAIRATDRVGKGIRSAPRDAIIAAAANHGEEGRAFGFHRAMDHAGAVLGPLVASALLFAGLELRSVFAVAIVPGILSVVSVLIVREPQQVPHPHAGGGLRPPLSRSLRGYLAILALFALGNSSDAFLLLRAREVGVEIALLPVLWAVLHVSKLVWSYAGGRWADRLPRRRLIALGWGIYAVTYVMLGLATAAWQAWALFVVYGAYYGLTEPAEKALVKELAPEAVRGRAYGLYNFVLGAAAIPAGLLTGFLWEAVSPLAALATGATIALLSAALMLAAPQHPSG